jgi:hypothetical protein
MALQLSDLGEITRTALRALGELGAGTRVEIANQSRIAKDRVSQLLNRLEALGLVEKPEKPGGLWKLTKEGIRVLSPVMVPAIALEPPDPLVVDAPVEESNPPEFPESIPPTPPAIFQNQEIELALAHVRTALQMPVLPALEARIYRAVLEILPPDLSENMPTITRWVNSHGTPY